MIAMAEGQTRPLRLTVHEPTLVIVRPGFPGALLISSPDGRPRSGWSRPTSE